jgi:predicted nucleotidyltransferase
VSAKGANPGEPKSLPKGQFMENVIERLVNSLKPSHPSKIILFGSHAKGTATSESDVDLMVILDNDDVAKTYQERLDKKLVISKLVREINYETALDILIYSKEEFRLLKERGNSFLDEIEKSGKVIYEKGS